MIQASRPCSWFQRIVDDPAVRRLEAAIETKSRPVCRGVGGSSTVLVAAALATRRKGRVLLVVAHLDDADEALEEVEALGVAAVRFPAMEAIPGETSVNLDLLAERLSLIRRLREGSAPELIVAPIAALMQGIPSAARLEQLHRVVRVGQKLETNALLEWLAAAGYQRVPTVDGPGEFAVRGGIIDIFSPGAPPARLDLFGEEIESICEIDLGTMGSDRRLDALDIIGAALGQPVDDGEVHLLGSLLSEGTVAIVGELAEVTEQGRSYLDRVSDARGIVPVAGVLKNLGERCTALIEIDSQAAGGSAREQERIELPVSAIPSFSENAAVAIGELVELAEEHETFVLCQNEGEVQRIEELIADSGRGTKLLVQKQYLHRGLIWGRPGGAALPLLLAPSHELLHRYQTRRRIGRLSGSRAMDAFLDMQPGDHVVHRDHGIARFPGLQSLSTGAAGPAEEYLTLEFAGRTKLHVPASKIDLVQKYVGAFKGQPQLSTLGGKRWAGQKKQVEEAVRDLAAEMLQLQAAREALPGIRYPADTAWQKEFEAEFPYEETEDQLAGHRGVEVGHDRPAADGPAALRRRRLRQDRGGDPRRVQGRRVRQAGGGARADDLARRAARPHLSRALRRLPVSRSSRSAASRPASSSGRFSNRSPRGKWTWSSAPTGCSARTSGSRDLGLVIIDEEQRFGVEHKQRLLEFRTTADVLTMTATPIPRTLHMSMLGLRDISSPDDAAARPAGDRHRGDHLRRSSASGRRSRASWPAKGRSSSCTIACTTSATSPIWCSGWPRRPGSSSGTDRCPPDSSKASCAASCAARRTSSCARPSSSRASTSPRQHDVHQQRRHVRPLRAAPASRSRRAIQAPRVLLPAPRSAQGGQPGAMKRLRALESFTMLGAGFKIALRDLEIRGAGNLLGAEQSGHIAAVGYEMYCQLLERAVAQLKNQPIIAAVETTVDVGVTGTLPKGYIPSDARRMDAYRRISQANTRAALEQITHDLISAYGDLPESARRLLDLAEIRVAATVLGVRSVTRHEQDIIFRTAQPRRLEERMAAAKGSLRLVGQPDGAGLMTVYYRPPPSYFEGNTLLTVLRTRLSAERSTPTPAAVGE